MSEPSMEGWGAGDNKYCSFFHPRTADPHIPFGTVILSSYHPVRLAACDSLTSALSYGESPHSRAFKGGVRTKCDRRVTDCGAGELGRARKSHRSSTPLLCTLLPGRGRAKLAGRRYVPQTPECFPSSGEWGSERGGWCSVIRTQDCQDVSAEKKKWKVS